MRWKKGVNFIVTQFKNIMKPGVLYSEKNPSLEIINDGRNNDFPDYLRTTVAESPVASACIQRLSEFYAGRDLHPDIKDLIINDEGQTFLDLHQSVTVDFAVFDRYGIKINPLANGRFGELYHCPAEWLRYKVNEDDGPVYHYAKLNPYLNTGEEYWKTGKTLRLFTKPENIRSEISESEDYHGHLLYYNPTSFRNRIYSRPPYSSAIKAIVTDARVWEFHERNTANNFFLGGILSIVGDPDKGIGETNDDGEYYQTYGEVLERQLHDVFAGTENAGNLITFWRDHADDASPEIVPWPSGETDKMFIAVFDQIIKVLSIATGVPQVLIPIPQAGRLGESQEIRNAIKFLNEKTEAKRQQLEKTYRILLEGLGVNFPEDESIILPIADITDLPEYVFNAMNTDQKRDYLESNFGIEPGEEEETGIIEEIILNGNGSNNPNSN